MPHSRHRARASAARIRRGSDPRWPDPIGGRPPLGSAHLGSTPAVALPSLSEWNCAAALMTLAAPAAVHDRNCPLGWPMNVTRSEPRKKGKQKEKTKETGAGAGADKQHDPHARLTVRHQPTPFPLCRCCFPCSCFSLLFSRASRPSLSVRRWGGKKRRDKFPIHPNQTDRAERGRGLLAPSHLHCCSAPSPTLAHASSGGGSAVHSSAGCGDSGESAFTLRTESSAKVTR
jgi:hypothetical protein